MGKRITLADVAARAGVSVATVSFVLNDRPGSRIPPATAERVREAASDLGYAVDQTARGLRTGRSEVLGFISDEVTLTRYASAMIRGILNVGERRRHAVLMAETDHHPKRVEDAIRVMRARRVDGLLLGLMRARHIELPRIVGDLPTVVVNGKADGHHAVLPDEYVAGTEAVRYLVERGHREIALIGRAAIHRDPRVSVTIGRRIAGIETGMAEAGLRLAHEVEGHDWEPELGYRGAREILEASGATAIIAANDRVAFGVYQAAQEAGAVVGDTLSVMSFDDEQLATYLRPQITTLRLPYLEMGEIAAELLLTQVAAAGKRAVDAAGAAGDSGVADAREADPADSPPSSPETLVPMPLIERGSVHALP